MFLTLLIVTFGVATLVSIAVTFSFSKAIDKILKRIIADEISAAWRQYMTFALYVVGISSGVQINDLEQFITSQSKDQSIVPLTSDRWILEVYRTVIDTLQGLATVLLIFFIFALISFVLVRIFELRREKRNETKSA
jgi:O-antigen/teichoic acid export membrane protein